MAQSQALLEVLREMQSQDMRTRRKRLYDYRQFEILQDWPDEIKVDANDVCHCYSTVTMLCEARLLPRRFFREQFGTTIVLLR